MLENFRKYTGLMFAVLILLFVGLVFFGDSASKRGYGQGAVVVEVDGRGYTQQEQQRMALSPLRLLNDLSQQSFQARFAIAPYLYELATPPDGMPGRDMDPTRFLVNRLLLQKGMKEFGVYPSLADIEEFQRETIFVAADGSFDENSYNRYVERSLPRLGMNLKDMNELLREVLALQTIQDIVGAGLNASPDSVRESVEDRQQQIDYQLITLPASSFEAAQTPSEEDIRKFWEENKGAYRSDAKRKVSYILAKPDFDTLLAAKKKAAEAAPPSPEAEATPEAEAPDQPAGDQEPPKEITLTDEEREAAVTEVGIDLDALWDQIQLKEGEGFATLAKEAGYEVQTTELFTREDAPAEFKVTMRDDPAKRVVDIIFERDLGISKLDAISDVRHVDKDQWLLFQIDEAINPVELTFEEAREEAKLDLVKKLAREAMEKAAADARTKLAAALQEGKSFQEAAAALELTPVARTAVTSSTRPPDEDSPAEIFDLASKVNPGQISEVLTQNDPRLGIHRSSIVYVDKRELVDSEANRNMVDQRVRSMGSAFQRVALTNWLAQEYAAANVREPALK